MGWAIRSAEAFTRPRGQFSGRFSCGSFTACRLRATSLWRDVVCGGCKHERREILGRIAGVYIVVEGGPGTQHEAAVAQSCGATIIPVGRSGGAAAELYNILPCPPKVDGTVWSVLNEVSVHPRKIAQAVSVLVLQLLQLPGSSNGLADMMAPVATVVRPWSPQSDANSSFPVLWRTAHASGRFPADSWLGQGPWNLVGDLLVLRLSPR